MKLYEFKSHLSFEDMWLFQKFDLVRKNKASFIIEIFCATITLIIALGTFIGFEDIFYSSFLLILGLFFIFCPLIMIYSAKQKSKQLYKTEPGFDADCIVTINDDHIIDDCGYITLKIDYSAITEYLITPQMIVLYFGTTRAVVIPRRLFNDETWNWMHNFFMNKFSGSNTKITISNKIIKP